MAQTTRPRPNSEKSGSVTPADIAELSRTCLFRDVHMDAAGKILGRCPVRTLAAGEVLIEKGLPNNRLFLLLSGRLRVHFDSLDQPCQVKLEAGECVGEMSTLESKPTTAYVAADEECRILEIGHDAFWLLITDVEGVAHNLLRVLSGRLRRSREIVAEAIGQQKLRLRYPTVDTLTGLYNRRWLENSLMRLLSHASSADRPLTILLLDPDHFGLYNEHHGREAGDHALCTVSRCLRTNLRPYDLAARYGGGEFAVLLCDTDKAVALKIAERLCGAVGQTPVALPDGLVLPPFTVSIGIAQATPGETHETLLAAARAALHRAKQAGRNRVSD